MILSALGDGFLSLAIFIVPRNGLVLPAGRLNRVSEHKNHAALHGKISPRQTDQAMCAMASDMAFKVALVIKNLALIFGFEAEFWTIKFGLISGDFTEGTKTSLESNFIDYLYKNASKFATHPVSVKI